jgi:hypothetical protein
MNTYHKQQIKIYVNLLLLLFQRKRHYYKEGNVKCAEYGQENGFKGEMKTGGYHIQFLMNWNMKIQPVSGSSLECL